MSPQGWLNTLPDEALRSLELREWHEDEVDTYTNLLNEHHYLKCPHARKRHLSQVVYYEGKAVALLIWTTRSRKLIHRDEHIGWDSRTREKRLSWIVQNNRFLLLPQTRAANLASRILGLAIKALNAWMQSQSKKDELPELLSIDGKVIASNLATIVSLVNVTDGSPVAQAAASGNGQEQKLTTQLIEHSPKQRSKEKL